MQRATRPTLPRLVLGLVSWLALAGSTHAAGPLGGLTGGTAPAADVAPASASKIDVVPAGDIPLRADADERFVQEVTQRARATDPAGTLAPRLEQIAEGVAALSGSFTKAELDDLSVVRLSSIEKHWKFYDRGLAVWRGELDRVMTPYSEDAAALAERRLVWEATQQALTTSSVPGALTKRVAGILAQISVAEDALSNPLETQIRLGRRANTVQAGIDSGLKVIDAAIKNYDRRLARIDTAPVWEAWQDTGFTEQELRGASTGLRIENSFLREWTAANQPRIAAYKITMLVLLPVLLWLWFRNRSAVATAPEMLAATRVLRRPVSAWFVLAFVGLPFFFPDAPLVLHQVALLLAMVPVLRLLPPVMFDLLGSWPYTATALYVAYRLSFLLLGQPVLYRLYLLGVAVVTAGALVWLLLSSRSDSAGAASPRIRGVLRAVGWLAVIALLVGIAADVIGNVTLAEMLTSAVLDSAYMGLALFAGANVLSSVLSLVMARRAKSRFRLVTQHAGPLLSALKRLIMLAALVLWLVATGNEFRIARPVFAWLKGVLTYPLEAGQISVTLGSILLFFFAVWVAFWVSRTVRLLLRDEMLPNMQLPRGVANSVATLSYYALLLIGLLIALAAAGFETSQFALVFGALGVGIGFGLQNIVNNFVSGLILMFERPIQPGDVVEVSGTSGKVREIGMRATTLTTFEGADVIVPNGTLLSEKLINWTLSDMNRRIDVEVAVAYGSDPRRVLVLLREVAEATPGIVADPVPAVVFKGFGANALEFGIRAWTHDFGDWVTIRTEMTARVYEALQREGLEIPFPQHDLHLRTVSDEVAARWSGPGGAPPAQPAPVRNAD